MLISRTSCMRLKHMVTYTGGIHYYGGGAQYRFLSSSSAPTKIIGSSWRCWGAFGALVIFGTSIKVTLAQSNDSGGSEVPLWIGVDGGGTKTSVVCVDASGDVVGRGSGPSCNHNSVGETNARDAVRQAIQDALHDANHDNLNNVRGVCLGMSGVDREEDKQLVESWMTPLVSKDTPVHVHNDAITALASGTKGHLYGVVVISGTGTIAYGHNKHGKVARASGWGPLLGDEGSGYELGHQALRAVVRSVDGSGPQTSLLPAVLQYLHLQKPQELIPWAYADMSWSRIASISPLVEKCAIQGDSVAKDILEHNAHQLAKSIDAVVAQLDMTSESFPIVLSGGVLTHDGSIMSERLSLIISKKYPNSEVLFPSISPATAAAFLSLNHYKSTNIK